MDNPPYSPDLASRDYHLFPTLKKYLCGHRFSIYYELKFATEQKNCG